MKKKLSFIFGILCCIATVPVCNAANTAAYAIDTLKSAQRVSGKSGYVASNYGTNAIGYFMSKRFRYSDAVEYSNKDFFSHLYVGGLFSYDMFAPRYNYEYEGGNTWGILLGKEINRLHSAELLFMYGINKYSGTQALFERSALQLNHNFNFTRYYLGYNPWRKFEVSSSLGVGVQFSTMWDEILNYHIKDYTSPYVYLGVKGAYKLGRRVNLVLEPHMKIGSEGYNGAPKGYWYSGYNVSYGAQLSLNYTFKDETTSDSDSLLWSRDYVFVSGGLQSLNSDIQSRRTLGPALTLGYGRWLARRVALQLSLGYSSGGWLGLRQRFYSGAPSYTLISKSQYAFGRAEGVINVYSSRNLHNGSSFGFSANILAGYEFGRLWKYRTSLEDQTASGYSGFTGGVRLRGHLGEGKVVFLEPRVTFATYGIPALPYKEIKNYLLDSRYTLAVGIEYGNPYFASPRPASDAYVPRLAFSLSGGTGYVFNRGVYDGGSMFNGIAGISFEYQPFALFGARAQFDYGLYNFSDKEYYRINVGGKSERRAGLFHKTYHTLSAMLDAKFDLSNAIWGYDPTRRWNASLYAGPIVSRHRRIASEIDGREPIPSDAVAVPIKRVSEDYFIGGHVGFNTRYSLTNSLSLFSELDLRIYGNDYIYERSIDYNPVRILGGRLGVDYDINYSNLVADFKEELPFPSNYVFVSGGLQSLNSNLSFRRTLGPALTLGYGHWFTRRLGVQLSGGYSSGGWIGLNQRFVSGGPVYKLISKSQYAFARAEGMFNVYSSRGVLDGSGLGFSANLLAGYEFGGLWKYRTSLEDQTSAGYSGFTGAVRLRGHIGEGKSVFLEPRVTFANYEQPVTSTRLDPSRLDSRYSLAVGIEYGNPYFASPRPASDAYVPRMAFSLSGGTGYVFNRGVYDGGSMFNGIAGISFEYQPFVLFGARAQFDYGLYNFSDKEYYRINVGGKSERRAGLFHKTYHTLSGILDLKFDLSNAIWGYDPTRRWNASLYAGPIVSRHRRIASEIDGREPIPSGAVAVPTKRVSEDYFIGGHVGFNTRYSLTERLGLFSELDLRIYGNDYIYERSIDYNPVRILGGRIGVDYDINYSNLVADFKEELPFPSNYVFVSGGLQSLNSNLSFRRTLGPALTLGYGHWFTRRLGVQLSGGYSSGGWIGLNQRFVSGGPVYKLISKSQYAFARAEGMFNVYSSRGVLDGSGLGFSANLLAGYEFGGLWKYRTSLEDQTSAGYSGFTGAVRLRGHIGEGKSVFLEPRVTFANYEQPVTSTRLDPSRLDSRYSLAVGIEYGNPYFASPRPASDAYVPRMAFSLSGGTGYVFNRGVYDGGSMFNGIAGISFEYQPFVLFGARAQFDYGLYNFSDKEYYRINVGGKSERRAGLFHKTYHTLSGILDLKFDLSNAIWGYDPTRRWNASLYAGPIVSRHRRIASEIDGREPIPSDAVAVPVKRVSEDYFIGGHLGFNTRYSLTNSLSLFSELDLRVFGNDYIIERSIDYNPVRILGGRLGVEYDINYSNFVSKFKQEIPFPSNYVFVSGGLQSLNSDISFRRTLGPALTLGYGHWFTRRLGVQLSGGYSSGGWVGLKQRLVDNGPSYLLVSKSQYMFGRAEGVLNVFSSRGVLDGSCLGFSANVSAGYEFGRLWKYRTSLEDQTSAGYSGFTGAVRLRGHIGEGKVVFVEPRVTFANYEQPVTSTRLDPSRLDSRYSLAVGIEYGNPYFASPRPASDAYVPRLAISLSGGTGYVFNRGVYDGGAMFNGIGGIGLEYQPLPLFGVRAQLDYGLYNFSDKATYRVKTEEKTLRRAGLLHRTYHTLSAMLDAKFDLSNAIWGYDPTRRWNASLYAGPVISRHTSLEKNIDGRESIPAGSVVTPVKRAPEGFHIGGHIGFNTSYSLTERLRLFGELDLRIYGNDYIYEQSIDYNPVRILGGRIGVTFDIK